MIYLTGDTHGDYDYARLSKRQWWESRELTKNDYLIVLGDFGLYWDNRPDIDGTHRYLRKFYRERPFTTLWIDGNHENHPLINALPVIDKFGGKVHDCGDGIYHLMRGEIYEIEGKKILTIGGAGSIDKEHRTEGISWWSEELLSKAEEDHVIDNLELHNYDIDYVLTHTAPQGVKSAALTYKFNFYDPTEKFLEHVDDLLGDRYKHWYFGHFHTDISFNKYTCLYNKIIKLGELIRGKK